MKQIFYNKRENKLIELENKGNFIYYDNINKLYIDKNDLLTLEECFNIFSNKDLEKLIIKYK